MTTSTPTSINVTHAAYDGGEPFPEAAHYSEYVAAHLADRFPGTAIEVSDGGYRTQVSVYGLGEEESALEGELRELIATDLWESFCADGYKEYTETSLRAEIA